MGRIRFVLVALLCVVGCGDDGGGLDDYYPELPPASGASGASAGQVTDASQLVTGPAQSGLVGDFYIKNDVVSFIVQSPTRVIGVVPQGGNLVDAALIDGSGQQLQEDHFGELSLIYLVGRTCEHDRIEIVRDGSKGGPAVLRAIGKSGNNDFINLKAVGALPVVAGVDPDIEDNVDCATTYILKPGSTTLEVYHSLFNAGDDEISGPLGTLADSGGTVETWTNTRGFERADITQLTSLGAPQPSDYVVYQGPGVAYGLIPRHDTPVVHSHVLIAGVSIMLAGNSYLLEVLQQDKYFLHMKPGKGYMQRYDVVVGRNAADVDVVWRNEAAPRAISGRVDWTGGGAAAGARVGIFEDTNGNGQLDPAGDDADADFIPDDHAVGYIDVAADGTYSGLVPATGNLLVRAEVKNQGRSAAVPLADTVNLTIPSPIKVDFQIVDADTGLPIPGRLIAIGAHPAFPDKRVFEFYDRANGVVEQLHAIRGTTVDLGDGADPALYLPAGGTYRIYASRGTEWSVASQPVSGSANVDLTFTLKHVIPTPGYISSDWHVHQIGSPDSPVPSDERIRSAVSAGIEMFAVTDHDYVSNLQPLVEQMGLADRLRVVSGIEVTPFAYGHYNAWPMEPQDGSANYGAIDWARGQGGFAMLPGEIYGAMRDRGAQMVQVNHPRAKGLSEFQAAFSRANVKYDFDSRTIYGDYENASTPNDWLRLPGESLWSDQFNGLEVWNGFTIADSNGDMLRENKSLDRVMRDWLSMLSLGFYVTPAGNSDTHTIANDLVGMPRTYVAVTDDSSSALADGSAVTSVLATQTGSNNTPRDVVVSNGPWIDVKVGSMPVLGRVVSSSGTSTTFTVTVTSPDWAEFDTLEVFANSTPDAVKSDDVTVLTPLKCWTSRNIAAMAATDPCKTAPMTAEAMTVDLATMSGGGGFKRYEATVTITMDASDIVTRTGKTGSDAWFVFRARGDRAIFPIMPNGDAVDDTTMPTLLGGDMTAIAGVLQGRGVPAAAFTAPVFVDFDGGGYRAPFAP
jgi:hypothetical protein